MITLVHPDGRREKLRWTDQVDTAGGHGALVGVAGGARLLGAPRAERLVQCGARFECETQLEMSRVADALDWHGRGLPASALVQVRRADAFAPAPKAPVPQ